MTYLFDANLLIALVDRHHVHHASAHRWIDSQPRGFAWATCSIVQNAFIRITANNTYPNPYSTTSEAIEALRQNTAQSQHVFWPDDISLCDPALWSKKSVVNTAHLGDLYLLALAIRHGGKLATFDRRIPAHFIRQGPESLNIIGN